MSELNELKKFCRLLADESGKIIRHYYRTDINIETKSDESPVTTGCQRPMAGLATGVQCSAVSRVAQGRACSMRTVMTGESSQ